MNKKIHNNKVCESQSVIDKYVGKPTDPLGQLPTIILKWIHQYSQDLIVVWDEDLNLIYTSSHLCNLLNYCPSDIYGAAWRQILSEEDTSSIDSFVEAQSSTKVKQVTLLDQIGKKITFECKLELIFDDVTNQTYLVGGLRDARQVKESEELMIRSEKMSIAGQLAAGIAHEIRNPLTSLKGFLQLLKAGVHDTDTYIHIMSEEIDKIESITSEFLFVSKPLTDKKEITSVKSMVKDVTLLLNTQAILRNISVISDEKSDFLVYCDGSQIKQVLINIVKNAIEATPSSGTVEIVFRTKGGYIEIDIIDEGPGIPESVIDKICEPFYTTKQGGTGLGLMITKQIIEKHDGQLDIFQNNDKGSTFRIILPEHEGG